MINFFRKIRKQLASENKFSKYSRYAIGEIVLVVLGILIALQINNWNEDRKESISELNFLANIQGDLKADIKYYDQRLAEDQKTTDKYYEFIHKMYETQKTYEEFTNLSKFIGFPSKHLTIQDFTFKELVSSGNIGILKNETLKDSIISLYKATDEAAKHIQEYNEFSALDLRRLHEQPDLDFIFWSESRIQKELFDEKIMIENLNWTVVNDPNSMGFKTIRDVVNNYYMKLKAFDFLYFNPLKAKSIETVEMIQEELDKRK